MSRRTAHRVRFFDLFDCEFKAVGDSFPLANWQAKRSARATWILIRAAEHTAKHGGYPKAYRVSRYGIVVTEGWIDWCIPERPLLRPQSINVN